MNVTILSAFRDSSAYIDRYFAQMAGLRAALEQRGDCLSLIVGEGDSRDDSGDALYAAIVLGRYETTLLDVTHRGPYHGSVVHPERFKQLAYVWNELWNAIKADADAVVFLESDLVWQPSTLLSLIDTSDKYAAIAPLVLLERNGYEPGYFYDVWAGRKDGKHIDPRPPYFPGWDMKAPIQVDSMGSCLAMRGDLARLLTWPPEDVIVGMCRQMYGLGASIWLHPALKVVHL